ncbi:MAG: hypothetical protein M1817_000124 [Caeruleum heppii]|nr:MAG: hypothetical protein M1817_000124 [Caeruleum heppii]
MYRGPGNGTSSESHPARPSLSVTCFPPLGQATVLAHGIDRVQFTVSISTLPQSSSEHWKAAIWHNAGSDGEWTALDLKEQFFGSITCLSSVRDYPRAFTGFLSKPPEHGPLQFTVRYRSAADHDWQWVNHNLGLADGQVLFQGESSLPTDLKDVLESISPQVTVTPRSSQTPDTALWTLEASVKAAHGTKAGSQEFDLGLPRDFVRWMGLVRFWSPWLSPQQGKTTFLLEKEAILLSFLRSDGLHLAILAISGIGDVVTLLHSGPDNHVIAAARNDGESKGTARLVVGLGKSFDQSCAAVMYHARKIMREEDVMMEEAEAEAKAAMDGVKPEWMEHWYDGLTYCTWNSLGQQLSEQKIVGALKELKENHVHITNLIIDDNWQSLDNNGDSQFRRGWERFEANNEGFPNGLKAAVDNIRKEYPNIQHIAVWHAILGYWGGIAPKGELAAKYSTIDVRIKKGFRPPGGVMRVVDKVDVNKFYEDFYRSGIDSVKTDAQFFLDELQDAPDRRALIKAYQDAWIISSLRYFSIKAISCMSQTPQIIFHSQLPTNRPALMVRNSDDFFPEVPASHPWHIFCNAHNSLLTQHLNLLPDWDMFQTSHEWAGFHGAARCVSGGPIYITDTPGEHDLGLINQMTAITPKGTTITLRPHVVGKTTQQYAEYTEERLTKVGTYVGKTKLGVGILGVFNVSQHPLTELVSLNEFPGVVKGEKYIIRSFGSRRTAKALTCTANMTDMASLIHLELPVKGWEILSAYPLRSFPVHVAGYPEAKDELKIALLGLMGKMTGAAAVLDQEIHQEPTGRIRISARLKALGVLGIHLLTPYPLSIEQSLLVTLQNRPVSRNFVRWGRPADYIGAGDEDEDVGVGVLEVDVLRAWRAMGLQPGWGNEVGVEVFVEYPG